MASDASLSATSKRAKKKAAAAAAVVAAAPSQVSTPEPAGSIHELDGEEKKHANPYIEVVSKRLRALRKKAQKLEKYDLMDRKDLNADQLLSLEKRPELVCQLKELEEIVKILTTVDVEEAENAKRRQKVQESETAAKVAAAVTEVNEANEKKGKATIRLLYALQNTLTTSTIALMEEEFTALSTLRAYITGAGLDADSADKYMEVAEVYLQKYLNKEDEEFVNRLTYGNIHDLVDRLLSPPSAPSFVAEVETAPYDEPADTEDTNSRDLGTSNHDAIEDANASTTVASAIISFFNPSEVITDEGRYEDAVTYVQNELTNGRVEIPSTQETAAPAVEPEVHPEPEDALAIDEPAIATPEPGSTPTQPNGNGVHRQNSRNGRGNRGGFRGGRGGYNRGYDSPQQQYQHHSNSPQQQHRVQQPRSHAFNSRGGKVNGSPSGGYRGANGYSGSPQQGVRNQ